MARYLKSGHLLSCRILLGLVLPALFCSPVAPQEGKPAFQNAETMPSKVEPPLKLNGVLFKYSNRRDPFLNPQLTKRNEYRGDEELSRGLPPPGIAGTYIAQAVLQGTALRDDGRVAVVRGADTRAYFLKEGDRLFDGYLRTIGSDSITLVRETKLRSGKTLKQDVTKRLRTP